MFLRQMFARSCVCVCVCMCECVQGASVFLKGHVLPGFNIETLDMWTEPLCVHVVNLMYEGEREKDVCVSAPTDRWLLLHQGQKPA